MSEDAVNDKGDPSRPDGGVEGDEERKDSNHVGIVINESRGSLEQGEKRKKRDETSRWSDTYLPRTMACAPD